MDQLGPPLPDPGVREAASRASSNTATGSSPRSSTDLSNGLVESTNTKIRLLTRIAFGFHSAQALIAMAMLTLGGHRPDSARPEMTHRSVRSAQKVAR